jgi:N utilization substance protein B
VGQRHHARRLAVQALFALDANPDTGVPDAVETVSRESDGGPADGAHVEKLVRGAWVNRARVDGAIEGASTNWKLSRMDRVDRSILRLGVYELMEEPEVPAPVILSEAVELAKEFGAPDSAAFVNGILDKVARGLRATEVKSRP